jgi:hypothetical protein
VSKPLLAVVALHLLVSVAGAQPTFTEENGCFTLTVPAGWRASRSERGTVLSAPNAGLLITCGPPKSAEAILDSMQAFVAKQWNDCKVVEHGRGTLAGRPAPWRLIAGGSRSGPPLYARLICVSVRDGIVSMMGTVAQKDYAAMKSVFEGIEASLRLDEAALAKRRAAESDEVDEAIAALNKDDEKPGPPPVRTPAPTVTPPRPAPVAAYRDPRGRFELRLPAGWTANAVGDATTISHGGTALNILVADGVRAPAEVVASLARQVGEQWRDFQRVEGGAWKLGGAPAAYAVFRGVNPRGDPARMRIIAAVAAGANYVLLFSVPQADWNETQADRQRLEEGFAFGPAVPPVSAPGRRATLGILSRDLNPAERAAGATQGTVVEQIAPGSSAAIAGIQRGDIVLAVGRVAVLGAEHLTQLIGSRRPGEVVEIRLLRRGKAVTVAAPLAARE